MNQKRITREEAEVMYPSVERRQELERKIISFMIGAMQAHGWELVAVDDGECAIHPVTLEEALDAVFSVDESTIIFRKGKARHGVYIVLGNDGLDCIADYGFSPDDDFDEVITKVVDPFIDGLQESVCSGKS